MAMGCSVRPAVGRIGIDFLNPNETQLTKKLQVAFCLRERLSAFGWSGVCEKVTVLGDDRENYPQLAIVEIRLQKNQRFLDSKCYFILLSKRQFIMVAKVDGEILTFEKLFTAGEILEIQTEAMELRSPGRDGGA